MKRKLSSIEMELASYQRVCEANAREKLHDMWRIERGEREIRALRFALNDFVRIIRRIPYSGPYGHFRASWERKIKSIKHLL